MLSNPIVRNLCLFLFFVYDVFTAKRAEFLKLNAFRMEFLILGRRIIAAPASGAFKLNKFSHKYLI